MTAVKLLGLVVALMLPALLPMLIAVGRRPLTVVLLLPAGGLLAAAAAELAVAARGSLTVWLVVVDLVVNAVAAAVLARRRRSRRPWVVRAVDPPRVLLPAMVGAALGLAGLSRPALDWDARSIWLLHARLLRAGGGHYVDALHNSAYAFAHVDYPPLGPATVATAWKVWGPSSYRLAQVLVALQAACLLVAAACLLGGRIRAARPRWLPPVLVLAFVVAALGPIGLYLTNGYTDVVVAAAATLAALALLVEPPTPPATAIGVLGVLVAATTKDEGVVAALLVVGLWVVRLARHQGRLRRVAPAGAATVAAVLAWPALVLARGGPRGSVLGAGTVAASTSTHASRFAHSVANLGSHLVVLPLVLVAAVAVVAATRSREREPDREPVGRDSAVVGIYRLAALLGLDLLVLLATYTLGKMPIHYWLRTSGDRVSILPVMLLDAIAVLSLACAGTQLAAAGRAGDARPAPAGEQPVEMLR